jgi:hypothetical protein
MRIFVGWMIEVTSGKPLNNKPTNKVVTPSLKHHVVGAAIIFVVINSRAMFLHN